MSAVLLDVRALSVSYRVGRRRLRALTDVSLQLESHQTLGVVGESGCGKSTLARAVLRLVPISGGEVRWRGSDLFAHDARAMRALRHELQMVFQDPLSSLDPRMNVGASVGEPLAVFQPRLTRSERTAEIAGVLARVGLSAELMNRYPHELSGGQCQRIAIARAVIVKPQLLVCDEPLSALDVSIQAQIVNLLVELKTDLGMSLLLISHNLAVVRRISNRVLVLYLGRTMEHAGRDGLFATPLHPYTRALLASVPTPDPDHVRVPDALPAGEMAAPLDPPGGCVFHPRCAFAIERCRREEPTLEEAGPGRYVACHRWRDLPAGG
jgi:oligopeptide transport system ATP-binding protein